MVAITNLLDLLTAFRAANTAVNPAGFFVFGRDEDINIDSVNKVARSNPTAYLIYLKRVSSVEDAQSGAVTYTCTLGFFKADTHDSAPDARTPVVFNREQLMRNTELIARQFFANFNANNTPQINNNRGLFDERIFEGIMTGKAIVFDIQSRYSDC